MKRAIFLMVLITSSGGVYAESIRLKCGETKTMPVKAGTVIKVSEGGDYSGKWKGVVTLNPGGQFRLGKGDSVAAPSNGNVILAPEGVQYGGGACFAVFEVA